jgi:hypothetical protein
MDSESTAVTSCVRQRPADCPANRRFITTGATVDVAPTYGNGGTSSAQAHGELIYEGPIAPTQEYHSSPNSSQGCGVRMVPLPHARSSAGQYLSQPQQTRSGFFG